MMGRKERAFGPLPPLTLEDLGSSGSLLSPPGAVARPELRARPGARGVCRHRAPLHRPGRLLQAATDHVLRRAALRAPTDAGGRRPAQPALVSRLRPDRAAARPLQSDPHPRALRAGGLPPLLRGDRRAMPRGRLGLGQGTLLRRHQGRGQRLARFGRASLRRRGAPGRALRRGGGADGPATTEEGADGDGPTPLPVALTAEAQAALAEAAASRHDWIGEAGRPDRTRDPGRLPARRPTSGPASPTPTPR